MNKYLAFACALSAAAALDLTGQTLAEADNIEINIDGSLAQGPSTSHAEEYAFSEDPNLEGWMTDLVVAAVPIVAAVAEPLVNALL